MPAVPKKVTDRLQKQVSVFQKILTDARTRDVNESDTVTIVTDMLADIFGFDKYTEVTSEQSIRGTYCDLAITLDGTIKYLIEVKAIGLELKDNHLRQAVNYGANHGIPWVVLTNGVQWDIYRIKFERPIDKELTCSINFLELNSRKADDASLLYLLCKEGLAKDAIDAFHEHAQIVNRFIIAAILQSDDVLKVVRRELRRLAPEARISTDEIDALLPDVLKRDVLEGNSADDAKRRLKQAASKTLRSRKKKRKSDQSPVIAERAADDASASATASDIA